MQFSLWHNTLSQKHKEGEEGDMLTGHCPMTSLHLAVKFIETKFIFIINFSSRI